jgi:uncharacterized protein (TIGR02147 family)
LAGRKLETKEFESRYLELTASQFKVSAEWEHFAVLSLMNCEEFKSDAKWIAGRLGISEARAREVLNRLLQVELIKRDTKGRFTRSQQSFRTPDDVADISLKKHHEQTLALASGSLFRDPVSTRDFTSVTMAIDPSRIATAKELLRKLQDDVSDVLETGQRTEVYRLAVQLFPLSRINDSGDEK